MPKKPSSDSAEQIANQFVSYLFDNYKGTRHVRRVATWIGFVLKAIQRVAGTTVQRNRSRQIMFERSGRKFKARYNHKAGPRGGIEIVEAISGRGMPDGEIVFQITNLAQAEDFYLHLEQKLYDFLAEQSTAR